MSFISIHIAEGEMEASIIKGLLESEGINSVINPVNHNLPFETSFGRRDIIPYEVCVDESRSEEAKKILAERE